MTPASQVELFHLLFLRQFNQQISGKLYAIKGGCNLRFFFDSIRYSENEYQKTYGEKKYWVMISNTVHKYFDQLTI